MSQSMKSSNLLSYRVTKTVEHPSGYVPIAHLPSVDVVIPTFNSEANLKECLRRLRVQRYGGNMHIWIIDGGSTDGTVSVARAYDCEIRVNPGQYGTGRNGARHFGAGLGHGDLIWNLDSDNFLEGVNSVQHLVRPFLEVPDLAVSVPLISVPSHGGFDWWLAYQEKWLLDRLARSGVQCRGYSLVDSPDYGLPNAHIIKRRIYNLAGGYDGDIRMLARLRMLGLSKSAIVTNSNYLHHQSESFRNTALKWIRRVDMFSTMSSDRWNAHWYERDLSRPTRWLIIRTMLLQVLLAPFIALQGLVKTRDARCLIGLAYPIVYLGILLNFKSTLRLVLRLKTGRD